MSHAQKGKSRKRRRSWHHGSAEGRRWWRAARAIPADVAPTGEPQPIRRGPGNRNKGDAL